MKITGARAVVECLKEQGVRTVFGYPGGYILPLYDELYAARDEIFHVLPAHEQGGAHAADGFARVSGEVSVCFATSGPGATNLVTGIATAYLDSSPVVFITANVPLKQLGTDGFQEVDITGVTMGVTKHNFLVREAGQLPGILRKAFVIARSGRPGPVLVDIPKNILTDMLEYEKQTIVKTSVTAREETLARYEHENGAQLDALAAVVNKAQRPLIIAGGGVIRARATDALRALVRKNQIPVISTLMGLGAFPSADELYFGNIGMHGAKAANLASGRCDLLLVVGARFSDRSIGATEYFAPKATTVHIDIDSAEFGKNYDVDVEIHGDADVILELLGRRLGACDRSDWAAQLRKLDRVDPGEPGAYTPGNILRTMQQTMGKDATIVTDVGQHQMWTAQFCEFGRPGQMITSGGLGTMGFGLGAAIGAKIAGPERQVVLVTGDGCLRMNCNELATAQDYGVGITILLMNNGVLGMVRQWQTLFYDQRYSQTTLDRAPDFAKLAEAYGHAGVRVENMAQLQAALDQAKEINQQGRCMLINCVIDKDEMVLPMVEAGTSIEAFIEIDGSDM